MFESRSCPSEDVLLALLEERVDESLHSDVLEHAEACEHCSSKLQQLADSWSLGGLARAASAGHETLAIEQHLINSPPTTPRARVVVPERPPVLEGYSDLELVSSGGMGVVYRARDTTLNRSVAIKLLSVHASSSQRLWQRADREAQMLARLAHPNVVAIFDTGRWGDIPYIVMEWIPGVTLRERLAAGPLDDQAAAAIARQIAGALADAHAMGIVHRDLKPDNILLAPPTAAVDEETPKLIDFGLARTDDAENTLTREGSVVGTPSYMAAEQTGLDPTLGGVGPATDIHGIGAVLFAMLTTRPPYDASTPLESMQLAVKGDVRHGRLLKRVALDLQTILFACLEPVPQKRYRSAADVADDLQRFLEGRPVSVRPLSRPTRLLKWARRRPAAAAAVVLAVLFGVSASCGVAYHASTLEQAAQAVAAQARDVKTASREAEGLIERLTSESVRRMLTRAGPLDEKDRAFLLDARELLMDWPLLPDREQGLAVKAKGLGRIADLLMATGRHADAIPCLQAANAALAERAEILPADLSLAQRRVELLEASIRCCEQTGRSDEAIVAARELISLVPAGPASGLKRQLAANRTRVRLAGMLPAAGGHAEARRLLNTAVTNMAALRAAHPDNPEVALAEIQLLFNSLQLMPWLDTEVARQQWQFLVDRGMASLEQFPEHQVEFAVGVSRGLAALANQAGRQQDWMAAVPFVRKRWELCRGRVVNGAAYSSLHPELIQAALQVHQVFGHLGHEARCLPVLEQAMPVAEAMNTAFPTSLDHALLLAAVLQARSDVARNAGQMGAASSDLGRVINLLSPWLAHDGRGDEVREKIEDAEERVQQLTSADRSQQATVRTAGYRGEEQDVVPAAASPTP